MLLLPHLREVLLGPVGLGIVCWLVMAVALGVCMRLKILSAFFGASALLLAIGATVAFEVSAARYSPNRDMPLIASGLFLTFVLSAFACGTAALALIAPSICRRLRKPPAR